MAEGQTNWHHLFGLMVQDFFRGTPCEVELERDLSVESQFLDVPIVHKTAGTLDRVLPDGLEGHLVEHDLITFESHQDTLSKLALDELLGHGVNHRKQVSPSFDDLLPEDHFRLFAICARFPEGLDERKPSTEVQEGVYEVEWGPTPIRIIVAGRLPQREPNALLHLFGASEPLLQYGREHRPVHSPETSTLVMKLFADYRVEGLTVPVDRGEFLKQAKKRIVRDCTVEERLEGIPTEQRLEGIPPEQLAEKLLQEGSAQRLTPDTREKLRRLFEELPPA